MKYLKSSLFILFALTSLFWGKQSLANSQCSAFPNVGDWNGDASSEIAVYDGKGKWFLDVNNNRMWDDIEIDKNYAFGYLTTTPVSGDWDGNSTSEIAVYDGKGKWYLDIDGNGAWDGPTIDKTYSFGYPGTSAVSGDWDGNGTSEIGVYDGKGRWYLDIDGNGAWDGPTIDKTYSFGYPGTSAVSGDWDGNGTSEIGVYADGVWHLDLNGNGAWDGPTVDTFVSNFGKGVNACPVVVPSLGPEISVGVWSYVRDDIRSTTGEPFKINANKNYTVKKGDGTLIGNLLSTQQTRVVYESNGNLQVYSTDAGISLTSVGNNVLFESTDGVNSDIIFDAHRPPVPAAEYDNYNHYRGKIELRYSNNSKNSSIYGDGINERIWVINKLPLEHYVWGMGELNSANVTEHNNVMVTIFRTYGKSKIEIETQYNQLGFDVLSTPASQKYNGYDYEASRPGIKNAAIATRGKIVTYNGKTALTAYSSWSDGTTRALDLQLYPYLKPVDDPYGNYNGGYWSNPYKSTQDLIASGNHMRGLIAWGSVTMAYDLGWDWERILKYYYTGISLTSAY